MVKLLCQIGKKQTGQIIRLARGKYRLRIQSRVKGSKRKSYSETYLGTRDAAEERLEELLKDAEAISSSDFRPKTVDQLLDEYLFIHRPNIREQTYELYVHLCQFIRDEFGEVYVHELTQLEIEKFLVKLSKNYQAVTIQKIYVQLKAALRRAVNWDWIGKDPMEFVPLPKRVKNHKEVLTPEELNRFINKAPEQWRTMWMFFFVTGARPSEVLGARWQDIDFVKKQFNVTQSLVEMKGRKKFDPLKNEASKRTIPLEDQIINLLKAHKKEQNILRLKVGADWEDNDLIFTNLRGGPRGFSTLNKVITHIKSQADISKKITPHSFRHTFATLNLNAGVNLKIVSQLLGHASIKTTADIYLHPDLEERQKASKLMTEMLFKTA